MHFTTRSFIGRPDNLSWSQYWENEPDDQVLVSQRGHLFALINVQVEDGQASDVGHLLINEINQNYFSSTDVPPTVWLKRTLETIFHNHRGEITSLSLTVAIVLGDSLHIAVLHQGICIFHRGQKISEINTGVENSVRLVSGKLHDQDQFLLSTPDFITRFTWDKIKLNLSHPSIQDVEESFLLDLSKVVDQSAVAGVLVKIHDNATLEPSPDDPPVVTPPPVSAPPRSKNNLFASLFKSKPVFVSHLDTNGTSRRKKINLIFSIIILAVLGVSIFFGAKQNKIQQIEKQYQTYRTEFDTKFNNASAMKNISLDTALSQAKEAKDILAKMSLLKVHSDEVAKLSSSVDALLSKTGSADVYIPENYYDTSLIGGSSNYSQIYTSKNYLYLLDKTTGRIDRLDIKTKSLKKILAANISPNIDSLAESNDTIYVLKDKNIFEINGPSPVQKINLSTDIKDFQSGSIHFWNGSLYVLANGSSIWKYTPNSSGFGAGTVWIKDGESLPPDASSFAINGEVWVIGKTGVITPFTRGIANKFSPKNTTVTTDAKNLVTALDSNILAFTDKDNLVYVYGKDGASAENNNFGKLKISSLALSSTENKIFVLCTDQKIYQIKL